MVPRIIVIVTVTLTHICHSPSSHYTCKSMMIVKYLWFFIGRMKSTETVAFWPLIHWANTILIFHNNKLFSWNEVDPLKRSRYSFEEIKIWYQIFHLRWVRVVVYLEWYYHQIDITMPIALYLITLYEYDHEQRTNSSHHLIIVMIVCINNIIYF